MKKLLFSIFCVLIFNTTKAQITYNDVASIFYSRCTSCHHTGASNNPFMNYAETFSLTYSIDSNLSAGNMPPWNADTTYTRFQHERIITSVEKQKILDWIAQGAPEGNPQLAPTPPVYTNGYQIQGTPDLVLGIGTFTSTSTTSDKYYCFSIPSGLTQDRIIRAFEVVPGNAAIVHHAVISADTTGNYAGDVSGSCFNLPGNLGIGTYAPGTKATIFPSQAALKCGIRLKAGSKVIIQMHYPEGTDGEVDSTKIRLFFYPIGESGVRNIYSTTPLQNWSMSIPANTVIPQQAYYPSPSTNLPVPISVMGLMPHSHLLCSSIINYAINPGVDTIELIRINKWNFHWQDYYMFKKLVKVPAGYRLYSKHIYDNTAANPNNPNSPPINVFAGTSTSDEMLFDGMLYMAYQTGDELIDVEALMNNELQGINEKAQESASLIAIAYPNPFNDVITIQYSLQEKSETTIEITDVVGRQICKYNLGKLTAGYHNLEWKGTDSNENKVPAGVYFYKISANGKTFESKIIKQN